MTSRNPFLKKMLEDSREQMSRGTATLSGPTLSGLDTRLTPVEDALVSIKACVIRHHDSLVSIKACVNRHHDFIKESTEYIQRVVKFSMLESLIPNWPDSLLPYSELAWVRVVTPPESNSEFERIMEDWPGWVARSPDPFTVGDHPDTVEEVEYFAMLGIADAQYYYYCMLGQMCVFDRFWHIKVKWLRRAAEQGHVDAIKQLLLEERHYAQQAQTRFKEQIYWEHVLVEKGAFSEIECVESLAVIAYNVQHLGKPGFFGMPWFNHSSYKISTVDEKDGVNKDDLALEEIKRRFKRLIQHPKTDAAEHARCLEGIKRLRGIIDHTRTHVISRFDAI